MSQTSSQQLPPKEQSIFKRIVKCYEQKQYKNGLKFAKQILSNPKFSEHGETLAMKGLILSYMGKKDEAWELVKRGLKNNLKSCICWHVFGLLQRAERKYDEAMKAYKCALRFESDNMQILRDLSLLQVQMRILDGYRDTRYQLLLLRPQQKASWIGYAMSFHLLGDYDGTLAILKEYCKTQKPSSQYDYEHSELLLYMVSVMLEAGQQQAALDFLNEHDANIMDRTYTKEVRARLCSELGRLSESETVMRELISVNPENRAYYAQLEELLKPSGPVERMAIYADLRKTHPRAAMPRRLPLDFLTGDEFVKELDNYLRQSFHKGVPQLFRLVEGLYDQPGKADVALRLVEGYRSSLADCGRFGESDPASSAEPPSTLVWVWYYLAQHYSKLGRPAEALRVIDLAIEHTPTLTELYSLKGQIYKDAGDIVSACEYLKEAQSLDTADRYVNSVCARYLIQAGRMEEAEQFLGRFTREGTIAGEHLADMQCMWYLTECAASYKRLGQYGQALKKCHEVERHFNEMVEDQFDFHSYCLRKMTLRAYVSMLRLEDKLKAHPYYFTAARLAIDTYLMLHRRPLDALADDSVGKNDGLSAGEAKKLRSKQRKAQKRAEQERQKAEQEQAARLAARKAHNKEHDADSDANAFKEEALDPEKLARTDKPLDQAVTFLRPLLNLCPDSVEAQCLGFDVYRARQRPLLMLRCLLKAKSIDASHPWLHACLVRFLAMTADQQGAMAAMEPPVRALIVQHLPSLFGSASVAPKAFNDAFLAKSAGDFVNTCWGLRLKYELEGPSSQSACLAALTAALSAGSAAGIERQLEACSNAYIELRSGDLFGTIDADNLNRLRTQLHDLFPYAREFFSPTDAAAAAAAVVKIQSQVLNGETSNNGDE
ncbi:hypothetical protein BOX15_Mlig019132g1 [Macrostomum lignano]|uniref:TPR_REGION domain-containing protein n=1 Tax=Macrostomum lignano TaxID=282301 RepID=A0A267F6X5_9PLAT|nr:hypothetical protein BOX15_Mlig019132g1 [Macrostomum lignano]